MVALLGMLSAATADDGKSVEEMLNAVVGVSATVPEQARTAAALGTERFGSGVVIDSGTLAAYFGWSCADANGIRYCPSNTVATMKPAANPSTT